MRKRDIGFWFFVVIMTFGVAPFVFEDPIGFIWEPIAPYDPIPLTPKQEQFYCVFEIVIIGGLLLTLYWVFTAPAQQIEKKPKNI